MTYSAKWIAQALQTHLVGEEQTITGGIHTDSRQCRPGSLYVARIGENADGHEYIDSAIENGAVCILASKPQPERDAVSSIIVADTTEALGKIAAAHLKRLREQGDLTVIGITGSVGKTTTKDLLVSILSTAAPTVGSEKSYNNEVGMPLTVLRADDSTRYLVLEMGASGRGHLQYLTRIAPLDIAVELAVGKAHLGGFGNVDALARAKAELVEGLVKGGCAILNRDDANVASMSELVKGGKVVYYSAKGSHNAQIRATHVKLDENSCPHFDLEAGDVLKRVRLGLVGRHQVSNALAAIAASLRAGLNPETIVTAINGVSATSPHRMHVVTRAGVTYIDDSYNANPDSMRAGLEVLGRIGERAPRRVAVLGEMLELGPSSDALHREAGQQAADVDVNLLVSVGEGAKAITPPILGRAQCEHFDQYEDASAWLEENLREGDVVFLKGSNGSGVWKIADTLIGRE
ncbi:MAG: UDP-N-acetylmuramoyl-tripeptide--D-alanyl-D-alanine ligase [Actinomycetaceae bacterium]|nr:UDP-N-acetylmuramoyl-tripeptide--D-alanyl-D-alanine ligase [Actinomycetaceae bacterium]